jgi:hypothetical protein
VLKAFGLRYWPLAVLVVLVIAILAMSRYAEDRKQSNEDNARQSSPATPISPNNAGETTENAHKTEHPPSWVDTFAWPEGATVWALFLTLLVIAWQSAETREAAKAAKESAEATLRSVKLQEGQLRQWVNTTDKWELQSPYELKSVVETDINISLGIENPTPMLLTLNTITARIMDQTREISVRITLPPEEVYVLEIPARIEGQNFIQFMKKSLKVSISIQVVFVDAFGDGQVQTLNYTAICGPRDIRDLVLSKNT